MNRLVLIIACGLLLTGIGGGQADMAKTHPSHMNGNKGINLGKTGSGGVPDYKNADPDARVLMRRRRDLAGLGRPDQRFSEACRRGQFRQVQDRRHVAVLNKSIYGAAVGGSSALHDPGRIAQARMIYIFVGQGTTNCRVYVGGGYTG